MSLGCCPCFAVDGAGRPLFFLFFFELFPHQLGKHLPAFLQPALLFFHLLLLYLLCDLFLVVESDHGLVFDGGPDIVSVLLSLHLFVVAAGWSR